MAKAKIVFQKLIQDSQDYGSDDEHMVSRAFFTLEIEGDRHADMFVDIKQPVGGDFEKSRWKYQDRLDTRDPLIMRLSELPLKNITEAS
jgi:hypothetical protein